MSWRWAAVGAALLASGCATTLPPPERPGALADLPGWEAEDHAAAFAAVRATCRHDAAWSGVCRDALAAGDLGEDRARAFLETHLRAEPIDGEGLLTGYFSPLYPARARADDDFSAPVRPAPMNPAASGERADIEGSPAPDALAWMRPEDLFFLQIQGSGVLDFGRGRRLRATFAGSNGRTYVAIGAILLKRGLLDHGSAGDIHSWLADHRGPDADDIMRLDPRYIFFRLGADVAGEPAGAAGMPLIPGRSLAVDPALHPTGELLWIDAETPSPAGARPAYRRLAIALDTGSAIRGEVRADLYLGQGAAAGAEAGRVHHPLRLWRLTPR